MSAPPSLPASVIIASRNRQSLLRDAVSSVLSGDVRPSELIVVDQSPSPDPYLSHELPRQSHVASYLWSQTQGVSRARNLGVATAKQPALVFIDDDVFVAADWLAAIVTQLEKAGEGSVVTGRVEEGQHVINRGYAPSLTRTLEATIYAGVQFTDMLSSGNMAIWRTTLEDVGGFDERLGPGTAFPAAEDNDLCFRLLQAGYRVEFTPRAVVYHRPWRPLRDRLNVRWKYGLGQGAFYSKHMAQHRQHMGLRLRRDIAAHGLAAMQQVVKSPMLAACEVLFTMGLVFGASLWALRHRTG